ncbi:MAG TPA: hypothetical protein VGL26_04000 [Jatrophihabitans sp.]
MTRAWSGVVDGERYELKDHGAQDIRAYHVVKDIVRVEKFIAGRDGADGAVSRMPRAYAEDVVSAGR